MAYQKDIDPNQADSHQTSPAAVITIVRWEDREPVVDGVNKNISTNDGIDTRGEPIAIHSDIINVTFSNTKTHLSPTFTATLTMGDINYATAIHPGDFAFLNMVNWQTQAVDIAHNAINLNPINNINDGFCGIFKIQTVRKTLSVDSNGIKTYLCHIAAAGFTEFNNTLFFNPALAAAYSKEREQIFQFFMGNYFANRLTNIVKLQELIQDLFIILIGENRKKPIDVENYGNTHFKMPANVGKLLGRKDIQYAADLYNYIVGVWGAAGGSELQKDGFNPGFNNVGAARGPNATVSNFFETDTNLQGSAWIGLDDWNGVTAWSIIQSYINNAMNEIYTCYRISPQDGTIQPTVVVRQKPYSSSSFIPDAGFPVTTFLSLPRWNISPDLVYSATLGFEETARVNFVQCFTRRLADDQSMDQSQQVSLKNFFYDKEDIQRNGLHPYVISSNFDYPEDGRVELRARPWARINADWVIGTHLKESGQIDCAGIQDPVCVGDNLRFDDTIYHIEGVTKNLQLMMDGKNRFTTSFNVSYGVKVGTKSGNRNIYPEMKNEDSQQNRIDDHNNEMILPGFSDTEDINPRNKNSAGEKLGIGDNNGFNIKFKK